MVLFEKCVRSNNICQNPEKVECVSGEPLEDVLRDLAKINNSRERAHMLFQWLISPIPAKTFFRYEQLALFIREDVSVLYIAKRLYGFLQNWLSL